MISVGYYNVKVKHYKDGSKIIIGATEPVFNDAPKAPKKKPKVDKQIIENGTKMEEMLKEAKYAEMCDSDKKYYSLHEQQREEENTVRSCKRAKNKIFDIMMQNDWAYFFTGTFENEVNRTDAEACLKVVQNWLRNLVNRKGLQYVMVAEYSPKNHYIHFHGLINNVLTLSKSDTVLVPSHKKPIKVTTAIRRKIDPLDWRTVYHVQEWRDSFGYCTAIQLDSNKTQYCNYITKYITKDTKKIFGKYYWSSRNIVRETENTYSNIPYSDFISNKIFKGKIITPPGTKVGFRYADDFKLHI